MINATTATPHTTLISVSTFSRAVRRRHQLGFLGKKQETSVSNMAATRGTRERLLPAAVLLGCLIASAGRLKYRPSVGVAAGNLNGKRNYDTPG